MKDPYALPERTMKTIECQVAIAARKGCLNYQDAEDLRQQCYLDVIKGREQFGEDKGASLETYLEKIVERAILRYFRDRARFKRSRVLLILDEPISVNGEGHQDADGDADINVIETIPDPSVDQVRAAYDQKYSESEFLSCITDKKVRLAVKLMLKGEARKKIAKKLGISYGSFRWSIEPEAMRLAKDFLES